MIRLLNCKIPNFLYSTSFDQFKDKYKRLFDDEEFIIKLCQQTRIYPEYFNKNILKQYFNSETIRTYREYISKYQHKNIKRTTLKQLFTNYPAYKNYVPFLECYLDWLLKNKLKKGSDQYYKNKLSMELFDMRNPQNWFTIPTERHFIYHHGPTNSGKTSAAIKQLKQLPKDKKGIYMAPLRLLAWEMQQKLGNCNLITGQDKQYRVSNLTSCTIQAHSSSQEYDVAIIDEIQMIGDNQRGWSWTKALLSLKAKRIHLCGDERALNLISNLVRISGGTLQERKYSRLGKLRLIHTKYDINKIQKGDCLIEFSVQALHKLRKKIKTVIDEKEQLEELFKEEQEQNKINEEKQKSSRTAMIYGKLPPECRKQQARKFNEQISPYLVATNAIGMGLNLNIKKIIFASCRRKNNKGDEVELQQHQIQQIAGRAGRGSQDGFVQCVSYQILKKVRKALKNVNKTYGINLEDIQAIEGPKLNDDQDNQAKTLTNLNNDNTISENYNQFLKRQLTEKERSIKRAGLFVQYVFLKRVIFYFEHYYHKRITLAKAAQYYLYLSQKTDERFFISQKNQLLLWVEKLESFGFELRDIFQIAKGLSLHYNSEFCKSEVLSFAEQFKQKRIVNIPIEKIKKRNSLKIRDNFQKLGILQANYSILEIYIYLWNKYEFTFWDIDTAKKMKEEISELIKNVLQDEDGFSFQSKKTKKQMKEQDILLDVQIMSDENNNRQNVQIKSVI